jgi:hypothetical protein
LNSALVEVLDVELLDDDEEELNELYSREVREEDNEVDEDDEDDEELNELYSLEDIEEKLCEFSVLLDEEISTDIIHLSNQ